MSPECLTTLTLWLLHPYWAQPSSSHERGMSASRVVSEEFSLLSDSVSSEQSQSVRPSSVSCSQFQDLMNWVQELENSWRLSHTTQRPASVHELENPWRPSHTTQRPASVYESDNSQRPSHATQMLASVLNPHPEWGAPPSSITATSTDLKKDKVKANPPFTFAPPDDIWLWILEVEDYFSLHRITDLNAQATVACSYLRETIHRHTQWLQLLRDLEPFSSWEWLQFWLLTNYSLPDAGLKADLAMNKLQMKPRKTIQSFINQFKIIIADLKWNESAVTAAFRRKLNTDISETVHFLRSAGWLRTFTDFKQVVQQAENHIWIGKRTQDDHLTESSLKKLRFEIPWNQNERRHDEWEVCKPSPFREHVNNIRVTALNSLPVSEEVRAHFKEKRHRREQGQCINCEGAGHWADKCTVPCNLSERPTISKNA